MQAIIKLPDCSKCLSTDTVDSTKLYSAKINEEILEKIMQLKFNFENLSDNKVRDAILKRKDYSFVIAYDLMMHEYVKKHLSERLSKL